MLQHRQSTRPDLERQIYELTQKIKYDAETINGFLVVY